MLLPQEVQRKISGKVTDRSGTSLPGASVVVKGTTVGTITDADGNFSIANIPENATLVFSFVGMKTQEVAIGTRSEYNVVLSEETIGLEEVIAIGYGQSVKKEALTGSVATIQSDVLANRPTPSVTTSLQGVSSFEIYLHGKEVRIHCM
jgi:hypothetical protein